MILDGTSEPKAARRHFNSDFGSPGIEGDRCFLKWASVQSRGGRFWHTWIEPKVFRLEDFPEGSEMPHYVKCRRWRSRGQSGETRSGEECPFIFVIPQSQGSGAPGLWLTGFGTKCSDSLLPASLCILGLIHGSHMDPWCEDSLPLESTIVRTTDLKHLETLLPDPNSMYSSRQVTPCFISHSLSSRTLE